MKEFLFTIWQRVQINLVAVIWWAIALLVWFFPIKNKNKKILEFVELNKWEVVDVKNKWFKETLEIVYWDKKVSKLSTYLFRIKNIGNTTIDKKEFIENQNFEIYFNENCEVIGYEIIESSSNHLENSLEFDYSWSKFSIKPFTFNSGEYIEIRIIIDGDVTSSNQEWRIKNVRITHSNLKRKVWILMWFSVFFALIYTLLHSLNKKYMWESWNIFDSSNYANIRFQTFMIISFFWFVVLYSYAFVFIRRWKGKKHIINKLFLKDLFKEFWW
jgi:hypothetical protein